MSKEMTLWYTIILFSLFLFMAIAWLIFARLTMHRIELQMKNDNIPDSFLWDGIGGRIFFYAFAIAFPVGLAKRMNQLIDVSLVRSYSNEADMYRGIIFLIATFGCTVVTLIGILIGAYR